RGARERRRRGRPIRLGARLRLLRQGPARQGGRGRPPPPLHRHHRWQGGRGMSSNGASPETSAKAQRERLEALCDDVLARATKRGATAAEVFAEHVRETSVSLEQNDIKGGEVDEHNGVGIRLFIG